MDALTLDSMKTAVMQQLVPHNVEVNIVGDLDVEEVRFFAPQAPVFLASRDSPFPFCRDPQFVYPSGWLALDWDERGSCWLKRA